MSVCCVLTNACFMTTSFNKALRMDPHTSRFCHSVTDILLFTPTNNIVMFIKSAAVFRLPLEMLDLFKEDNSDWLSMFFYCSSAEKKKILKVVPTMFFSVLFCHICCVESSQLVLLFSLL